jgi:hypothetical protein
LAYELDNIPFMAKIRVIHPENPIMGKHFFTLTDETIGDIQRILNRFPLTPIPRKPPPQRASQRYYSLMEVDEVLGVSRMASRLRIYWDKKPASVGGV